MVADDGLSTIECGYRSIPYRPATYWEPAEGGIELDHPLTRDGEPIQWTDLTEYELDRLYDAAREDARYADEVRECRYEDSRAARFVPDEGV